MSDTTAFAAAVRQMGSGGSAFDPIVINLIVGRRATADDPLRSLSGREREVLALMAEGRANQAIAQELGIAERTVEMHCTSIFTKLELPARSDDHRRVLAVLRFLNA